MSRVRPFWSTSSSRKQASSRSSGSASSSGVTMAGPNGPNPGKDLPSENCGTGPASCTDRSDRSCPTVTPATYDQACSSPTCSARRPMTTTSSTSQSTCPLGSRTAA